MDCYSPTKLIRTKSLSFHPAATTFNPLPFRDLTLPAYSLISSPHSPSRFPPGSPTRGVSPGSAEPMSADAFSAAPFGSPYHPSPSVSATFPASSPGSPFPAPSAAAGSTAASGGSSAGNSGAGVSRSASARHQHLMRRRQKSSLTPQPSLILPPDRKRKFGMWDGAWQGAGGVGGEVRVAVHYGLHEVVRQGDGGAGTSAASATAPAAAAAAVELAAASLAPRDWLEGMFPRGSVDRILPVVAGSETAAADVALPGWPEDVEEAALRLLRSIDHVAEQWQDENIIVVSHSDAVHASILRCRKHATVHNILTAGYVHTQRNVYRDQEDEEERGVGQWQLASRSGSTGIFFN
ncbi:unnamed protein product [Closterium sp. Yama58-4]|nr:unnamed protein product [Closterium sp. Yama58-4]